MRSIVYVSSIDKVRVHVLLQMMHKIAEARVNDHKL